MTTSQLPSPKHCIALAKMLEGLIVLIKPESDSTDYGNSEYYKWKDTNNSNHPDDWFEVRDTEWNYLVSLVEGELTNQEHERFRAILWGVVSESDGNERIDAYDRANNRAYCSATPTQRIEALCKLKGIEI